ncbi:DUF2391 domain-containing protein [Halomarina pelagica]|uniref:DUF2391 domain-containing protein n=1 Tax=Halomarina pelagica TaxID=2961599 RepID=UPI0020C2B90C|nr:DUF2391 domain-containing protein [Halomarina sp. BND7]
MVGPARRFKTADIAQQVVGGFLLAGPFVVTAEVWQLAASMNALQALLTTAIVFGIGYGALYKADNRDPDREADLGGVPVRFLSLMAVAFGSVLLLALAFDAPGTFLADLGVERARWAFVTAKAVTVGSVFSVVGAATADSVF